MKEPIKGYDSVAEVRKTRERLYEKYGDDWDAIFDMLQKAPKKYIESLNQK
ncbi:hypothetical protein [Chitinophaga silvisoli]|uniref:hypothetical protein n=1 Tax=Chitinophaga silvisoli TaxID=2291814 RepID=UPI0013142C6B|nr:hypothetical protein [Chitinophaga silvisoli]